MVPQNVLQDSHLGYLKRGGDETSEAATFCSYIDGFFLFCEEPNAKTVCEEDISESKEEEHPDDEDEEVVHCDEVRKPTELHHFHLPAGDRWVDEGETVPAVGVLLPPLTESDVTTSATERPKGMLIRVSAEMRRATIRM